MHKARLCIQSYIKMKDKINEILEELEELRSLQGDYLSQSQQLLFETLEYLKGDAIKPELNF